MSITPKSNSTGKRHPNYEILNLIGYGLAKFDDAFVHAFNCETKNELFDYFVKNGVAERSDIVKNRQDLFDPFFPNPRRGWWQKGDAYIHRKHLIDSLFSELDVAQFAAMVRSYLPDEATHVSPIAASKFKKLQSTGLEAECYFMQNFQMVSSFVGGKLEDARMLGDGYDFQIENRDSHFLAEVKGVRLWSGKIRMTENEYKKAAEYKGKYGLMVVCNLDNAPQLIPIFNPIEKIDLREIPREQTQKEYHSTSLHWNKL